MKLVGITGSIGSGKTTLAKKIASGNENVGILHIDDLMNKLKQTKFSRLMDRDNQGIPVEIRKNIINILYKNKYIFLAGLKLKSVLLNKEIKNAVQNFEKEGKEVVIIESTYLQYFQIFKDLNKRILVCRDFAERQKSVLERDKHKNMDSKTFEICDQPNKKNYCPNNIFFDYTINNDNPETLNRAAQIIYASVAEDGNASRRKYSPLTGKHLPNVPKKAKKIPELPVRTIKKTPTAKKKQGC